MFKALFSLTRWLTLGGVIGLFVLTSCASTPEEQGVAPQESLLRVGVSSNSPPLIYRKGDTDVGLEAELAKELGAYLGKAVRFIEVPWDDQIEALLDNRTDIIMSGMSITPLREVRIAFSKPYFRTGQMALLRNKHKRIAPYGFYGIMGISTILRFGVVKGTTGEAFVRRSFPKAKGIETFRSARDGAEALLRKKIDVLIHDAPMILLLAAENESNGLTLVPSLLTEEYLAWGLRKSDADLIASVNRFIDQITQSGRLDEIIERWIPFAR